MDFDTLNSFLLKKAGTKLELPFGPETLVYKVVGRIYATIAWEADPMRLNLKCDPEEAIALREQYPAITPGYHMSKIHWNTISMDDTVPDEKIIHMINESYRLVVAIMPKRLFKILVNIVEKEKQKKKAEN